MNIANINFSLSLSLSLTYKVPTAIQPTFTTWYLFSPLTEPALQSLSPFLAHQPPSHWKSQIAHLDNASFRLWNQLSDSFRQPYQSCLDSPLLNHVLSNLCYHHHSQRPLLLHSFHFRLKTYLFNKPFPPSGTPWTSMRIIGLDRDLSCSSVYFLVLFSFKFSVWFIVVDQDSYPSVFDCTLNAQYLYVYLLTQLLEFRL